MKRCIMAAAALIALTYGGAAQAQTACEALKGMTIPDVRITEASASASPAPSCTIKGVIGKEINFQVWLPEVWNGKFVMGGQGGYAGRVESQALAMGALQKGYAVAGTDTGHTSVGAADADWALGEMERIVNFAHLAVHRVTEVSKATVKARYGKAPAKSYFAGCSNGGREALMAAQRYPDDFDAIIAGAPALNFQGITATMVSVTRAMYPDPAKLDTPVLDKADRVALGAAVLAKCDAMDGLKDGIMADPRACTFDPKVLACKGANADGCLSKAEIASVEAITKGPMLNGKPYAVGYPWGGEGDEAGWGIWLAGHKDAIGKARPSLAYGFGGDFMKFFLQNPTWTFADWDLSKLAGQMKLLQATISPTSPDLSAYRARGGKLLMYHGWSDSALSPLMSLDYLDKVHAHDAGAKNDVKLFMLPGVQHCMGGPGPDRVDVLDALDAWAVGGQAPEELVAGFAAGGGARKICAWPKQQVFKGSGDGRSPDQFECR